MESTSNSNPQNLQGCHWVPQCDDEIKPSKEHIFDSVQAFEEFYKIYAHTVGFSVRSWTATKDKKGQLQYKYFVCSKEGFKVQKDQEKMTKRKISNTRVGCSASASVKRNKEGKFELFSFIEEHNHELCTPRKKHLLRSNRNLTDVQKNLLNTLDRVNIGPTQAFHIMKEQVGGYENVGFTVTDAQNYARDLKALMRDSDAHTFIENFKTQKERNPAFYYAYELDSNDHLKHVFWSDGISRHNFSMFGDLLSFDTTYNTNKYSMIFAPFTGLNHHRLSITFGTGLLADEKMESFMWLFENFKECMGGNEPRVIVTDQDPAMRSAIEKIFKNSKHRFCMWHIMKKLSEKVGGILNANKEFQCRFKSCVWTSETPAEFESEWNSIIVDFGLSTNEWLLQMYEIRTMWIPAYFRDIHLSGLLRTTSRSESENAFFGNYVNKKLGLIEFYSRFDNAIEAQRQKELKANHATLYGKPELKTSLGLEKHASEIFTHINFYKFQEELWASCMGCVVRRSKDIDEDEGSILFNIIDNCRSSYKCRDVVHSSSNTKCSCKLFESEGIPCRHIILVLRGEGMNELPSYCIASRWTKCATTQPIFELNSNVIVDISEGERQRRLISSTWTQLTRCMEVAKLKDEALIDLRRCALSWEKRIQKIISNDGTSTINCSYNESRIPDQIEILPPNYAKTKGSGKRLKGGKEKSLEIQHKIPRLCRGCGEYALHDSRNCPKKKVAHCTNIEEI